VAHDVDMSETHITITCDSCVMRHTDACDDCVVTFLYEKDESPPTAVVLDLEEQRAVRLLAAAGLIPSLKHREAI
jgi:hypothetical protein